MWKRKAEVAHVGSSAANEIKRLKLEVEELTQLNLDANIRLAALT
jgi:hypothetical protein